MFSVCMSILIPRQTCKSSKMMWIFLTKTRLNPDLNRVTLNQKIQCDFVVVWGNSTDGKVEKSLSVFPSFPNSHELFLTHNKRVNLRLSRKSRSPNQTKTRKTTLHMCISVPPFPIFTNGLRLRMKIGGHFVKLKILMVLFTATIAAKSNATSP